MRAALAAAVLLAACGKEPSAAPEGERLSVRKGCVSCHSVDGSPKVGPTWKGLFGSTVSLDDGTKVTADEDYIRESIRSPDAKTVEGFPKGVMADVIRPGSLTAEEIDALVDYIRRQR